MVLLDIICRVSGIMGACLGNFLPEMANYYIIVPLDSWKLLEAVGSFCSELLLIGISGRCILKFLLFTAGCLNFLKFDEMLTFGSVSGLSVQRGTDTRPGQSLRSSFKGSLLGNLCVGERGRALESDF